MQGRRQVSDTEVAHLIYTLNLNNLNINLTFKTGRHNMEFLDVMLSIDCDGLIQTGVFRKPTTTNALLHANSSYPRKLINGIPTGQFLRIRRICSNDETFEKQALDLKDRFRKRGYSEKAIQRSYRRAKFSDRKNLLYQQRKIGGKDIVRFISTFNSRSNEIWNALNKHWQVLLLDKTLSSYIPRNPMVTYRRAQNLRDRLVHSNLNSKKKTYIFGSKGPSWGCRPCGSCVACPNTCSEKTFTNADKSREYTITHAITCTTIGVIYSARCPCDKIYIGMTTRELRKRTREHVLDIIAAKEVTNLD
ncbi:uncharacterized protein [Phyllobates terribilis]|uniref:uncharacterized protein n=1 Tax=Phyllobates terribilis TaxID=111132 RepID=UPI003CCABEBA